MLGPHHRHHEAAETLGLVPHPLRSLMPVYGVVFIAFLGYASMVTLFVSMIMGDHGFVPENATRGHRAFLVGALLAMYPLGQFVGSPVIGALSDRYGRKRLLLISLAITCLCYVGIASAIQWQLLVWVYVGCFACGLAESNLAITQSVIADVAPPEDRGKYFGFSYVACSCGYIIGPLVGGITVQRLGFAFPFWCVLGLLAGTWFVVAIWFRDNAKLATPEPHHLRKAFTNLINVFTDKPIRRFYFVNFLIYFALFGFYRVILIFWQDRWQMSVNESTMYYSYMSFMALASNLFVMPYVSRKFPLKWLVVVTSLLGSAWIVLILLPQQAWSTFYTVGPASFITVLAVAGAGALISGQAHGSRQGAVMGNNQALQVLAEAMSAAVGGALAALWIPLPLLSCAVILALGVALLIPKKLRSPEEVDAEGSSSVAA